MSNRIIKHQRIKRLPLAVALVGCLYGASAFAQEATDQEKKDQKEPAKTEATTLDKITVTGSLLKRVEYDLTTPVQVIQADTAISVGQVGTAEFLQKSTVAAGYTQINHQFSGFVVEGGTGGQSLDLRGLGANRSLVLLNGQRPGPAGTQGQVGAFDLNVVPSSILQRAEIVKDGSSSIYGSDAVAGVVNLITRKNIDRPEFTVSTRAPMASSGGGSIYQASGAMGWNFDNGNIAVAAEYYLHNPLRMGDRKYLRCAEDLITDADGNRIDREDRSILAGTSLAGCNNLYHNTIIDYLNPNYRLVPSPDGSTVGGLPGYRPRPFPTKTYANSPQAYYEDVLNLEEWNNVQLINRQERMSFYGSSNFSLGPVNWETELLLNRRETEAHGLRQFFPYAYTPTPSGLGQIIMPFPSDQRVRVDYGYFHTGLDGLIAGTDTWSWSTDASYSRSSGDYSRLSISIAKSGDLAYTDDPAPIDYLEPCVMSGACMDKLVSAVGVWNTGNTVYDQFTVNGVLTGELFNLPAGAVGAAFGVEYRKYSIDDQPSEMELAGDYWGYSSAGVTKGEDKVKEVFAELEVPLLKGVPAFESLTLNLSARAFDYDSVKDSDYVWKVGLGWQIVPSFRVRATTGTSYRAPGLYELYLGDLSGFQSQRAIDPCINWGESTNDHIRANCAAAGIPDDYAAAGASSAEIFTGGGAGHLKPETSRAFTTGIIWTPAFAPISVALDYFDYEVNDQIQELDEGVILAGCYGSPVYPNNFCSMFTRNPPNAANAPNMITEVHASYVNVNKQRTRGFDMLASYEDDFSFGKLNLELQATYTKENYYLLFEDPLSGGLTRSDNTGYIGQPKLVAATTASLKRGDFTYTWGMEYVDQTENLDISPTFTYQGWQNAHRDIVAEDRLYHSVSVRWQQAKWDFLLGVRNLTGAKPPLLSSGAATRYGNVSAFATQYDLYGRTLFARLNYKF